MGDRITGGDIYGIVHENTLMEHRVMLPPNARGTITYLAPHGQYNIEEEIIEVEFQGAKKVRAARLALDSAAAKCSRAQEQRGALVVDGSWCWSW